MVDHRIAHDAQGRVLASPEIMVVNNMPRRQDGESVNVVVRGVTLMAFEVRSSVRDRRGPRFHAGALRAGRRHAGAAAYVGLDVGQSITLQRRSWTVVGVFEADGSGFESEIWGDLDVMAPAFNRSNAFHLDHAAAGGPLTGRHQGVRR